ncbi:MAG: hypothetical protein V3S64_02440 [bacterium]
MAANNNQHPRKGRTMQHPITHNSVIDRVQLIDTPPGQQDWAHLSIPDEDQGAVERPEADAPSGNRKRVE